MATTNLDDVDVDRSAFDGDGESTIDLYEVPEQLEQADGKSTVELEDIAGSERVLESIENNVGDFTEVYTSEPTHSKLDSANKQNVKKNVDAPLAAFPAANVENLASGAATLSGKDAATEGKGEASTVAKPAAKRGRPAKTADTTVVTEAPKSDGETSTE